MAYGFMSQRRRNFDVIVDVEERVYDRINEASARGYHHVTIPATLYASAMCGFTKARKEELFGVLITRLMRDGYEVFNDSGLPYYTEQYTIAW